ncbi:hypothetical protein [Nannocystis punicea]|uniref:Uncharacterized protein n=1 Tax=Nannocystis punicea TaxID=2995304 RepID=A0ABY7H337_9BACT|nr:hypothetical protein [Nannocystis poenicansa]WAS93688.1 hypothetical protein O0S08_46745 [Nannocystis poenicansa]
MSSDTFYIEIRPLQDDTVELVCTTSTAGGVNDYALTRSFVLMALADGMPYAGDNPTPLQKAMQEVGGPTPPVWQESFHREHVDKFIASTELVERIGIVTDERAWQEGRFRDEPDSYKKFPSHQFVLRARVTDPRYLEGLTPGSSFGTTAFDAWWDDPARPSRAEMAAVEARASRWFPPSKKAASEKKAASKKAASKKAASKKAAKKAAKKAPAKKAAKKTASKKAAKKAPAKKATKKAPTKKATKKAPTKKVPKKAPAKKAAKKAPAKKTAKKTATKKTAKKAPAKKAAKKAPAAE